MTRPSDPLDDDALAAALRAVGRALPGARHDIAGRVADVLSAPGETRRSRGRGPGRRGLVIAIALLVVGGAAAALAAGVVPGIEVHTTDRRVDVDRPPLVDDPSFLGERTTLAGAQAAVDHPVRLPAIPGAPQVYVSGSGDRRRVSVLYAATEGLPSIGGTGAGLLVTQFRGRTEEALVRKFVGPDADVTVVDVDGATGWWITGVHEVAYVGAAGSVVTEQVRYADRTLLWSLDGLTLRLEAAVDRDRALELATSMR